MNLTIMKTQLSKQGLLLDDRQLEMFAKYLSLLTEWNQKMDLTALKTDEDIIEKHFFDSLLVASGLKLSDQTLIDIGSGAGLPGIPLQIAYPNLRVTLLEPTHKRCVFLEEVQKQLNLTNLSVVNARAEDFVATKRETFDIGIARAVAPLNILAELSLPLVKNGGLFIAMKGPGSDEEVVQAKRALATLFASVEKVQHCTLFSNGDVRNNLFIRKNKLTPNKYPRSFSDIKKNPL